MFEEIEQLAHRQEAEEKAATALSRARARLILSKKAGANDATCAFFATLALRLGGKVEWALPTAAVDGRHLYYNPDFINALTPDETLGVLVHEVMHCAMGHFARRGTREAKRFNIACDLSVNCVLVDAGFTLPKCRLMPGEGAYSHCPRSLSSEEYYGMVDPSGQGEEGGGEASSDPGGCGGVREPGKGSPAQVAAAEADWKVNVAQAESAARMRGTLSAGLDRVVDEVVRPTADWRAVLREFVSSHAKDDFSWAKPNRRFIGQGIYLPGLHSDSLGDVVVAVDTSGSIGEAELSTFASELEGILGAYSCTLTIVYHDVQVHRIQTWKGSDGPLKLEPVGGGGTSHVPFFHWLGKFDITPSCVVCLTDLDTEYPASAPDVPVLWAVVGGNKSEPPFGRRVTVGVS